MPAVEENPAPRGARTVAPPQAAALEFAAAALDGSGYVPQAQLGQALDGTTRAAAPAEGPRRGWFARLWAALFGRR